MAVATAIDLLGPQRSELADGVLFEDRGDRLVLRAQHALEGIASGRFDNPRCYIAWQPAARASGETREPFRLGGYSYTQFALPVHADAQLGFRFDHGKGLVSPRVVFPLFAVDGQGTDARVCLLAPLDQFHEQVLAIVEGELRWGWHGDLDEVPKGFSTELAVYSGTSARALLLAWGAALRDRYGTEPVSRYADPCTSHLSYWTDNGAAYWYRREPGLDLQTTLERKLQELRAHAVPVHAVELDSWFYPHEVTREVRDVGYPEEVPPTGMLRWEPREDILPDGIPALRTRLGEAPLVLHSRHISAHSTYLQEGDWWLHGNLAHPADPSFFARFMRDAKRWGATTYEQDWLWWIWFGMRPLRAVAQRAREWQQGLDDAAAAHDLSLIWCMATPADFAASVHLTRLVAIRSCDDYRFSDDPAFLWRWFLVVNVLAASLGLWPFKDVFFSSKEGDGIDGDPHAEVEALLAALSAGPVGIGDRIGRTDPALIARCCRSDGLLLKPDRPIAALDGSLLGEPERGERLLWGETGNERWHYLVALHAADTHETIRDRVTVDGPALVYDWRRGEATRSHEMAPELAHRDWAFYVLCPIEEGFTWIGDPDRYATMADQRIRPVGERRAEILGAPGEAVRIRWWSESQGLETAEIEIPPDGRLLLQA